MPALINAMHAQGNKQHKATVYGKYW